MVELAVARGGEIVMEIAILFDGFARQREAMRLRQRVERGAVALLLFEESTCQILDRAILSLLLRQPAQRGIGHTYVIRPIEELAVLIAQWPFVCPAIRGRRARHRNRTSGADQQRQEPDRPSRVAHVKLLWPPYR